VVPKVVGSNPIFHPSKKAALKRAALFFWKRSKLALKSVQKNKAGFATGKTAFFEGVSPNGIAFRTK
jgi:hypothetical protein